MKLAYSEHGAINILLIPLVISVVCLFGAVGFGIWAFVDRSDYKNNFDEKSQAAIAVASQKLSAAKDNEFLEKEKFPLDNYRGPAELGSLNISYPKTWSSYVSTKNQAFFIFDPKFVVAGEQTPHALKITIEETQYSDTIAQYDGQIEIGKLKASAYALPKVPKVVGIKFEGELEEGNRAIAIILPLRDKTIKIVSELPDRFSDFNKIILPNLSFSP